MASVIQRRNQAPGVWYRNDILDILTAVDEANWDVAQHIGTPQMRLYRKGFEAAVQAIAAAFGLAYKSRVGDSSQSSPEPMSGEPRPESFMLLDVDALTTGSNNDARPRVFG